MATPLAKAVKDGIFEMIHARLEWRIELDNEWLLESKNNTTIIATTHVDGQKFQRTFRVTILEI